MKASYNVVEATFRRRLVCERNHTQPNGWEFIILESISMRLINRLFASARFALMSVLAGMALMAVSSGAWALTTCTGSAQNVTMSMPATISVPRDAVVGTPLSAWITSPATTNWFTCSATVQEAIGVGFKTLFSSNSGVTLTDGGTTYTVFDTAVPGVGVAVGAKGYANGCGWMSSWQAIGASLWGYACNSTQLFPNGGQIQVRLVKTGPITAGVLGATSIAQAQLYANGAYNTTWPIVFMTTATQVTVQSCVTSDVTVPLGQHKVSELKGAGTYTSSTGFNISLNSCPAGMNSISYQIDALTAILNSSASVVALDSAASAVGVGVQLLDGSGNVFPLGTPKAFSGYSKATGGNYTIPFLARYYQTDSSVTGGIANTAMTFTITYQ